MKIRQADYNVMLDAIMPLKDKIAGQRAFITQEGKAKDIEMRLRWDCFHAAKLDKFACDILYGYVNDDHIDTALKAIMKEIEK